MTEKKKSSGGILGLIKRIIDFLMGRKKNKDK